MAAWIKVGASIHNKPEVLGIAKECGLGVDTVVGKLIRMWAWFDEMSANGHVSYGTNVWLDSYVGHDGFAQACASVGWLRISSDGLTMPNFDRHNGESSKKRLIDAARKRQSRSSQITKSEERPAGVREMSHQKCDQIREDKIREEVTTLGDSGESPAEKYPPGFVQFWDHYPRKVGKGAAYKVWKRMSRPDKEAAIDRAEWFAGCWKHHDPHGDRASFIPHPATWLNGRRWEDDEAAVELAARGK